MGDLTRSQPDGPRLAFPSWRGSARERDTVAAPGSLGANGNGQVRFAGPGNLANTMTQGLQKLGPHWIPSLRSIRGVFAHVDPALPHN